MTGLTPATPIPQEERIPHQFNDPEWPVTNPPMVPPHTAPRFATFVLVNSGIPS